MISVTDYTKYLSGQADHATLVVPEKAVGAMTTVNAVLTRVTRLTRIVEESQSRARRDARNDAMNRHRAYTQSNLNAHPDEVESGGGGGHGSSGHGHMMRDLNMGRRILQGVARSGPVRALARLGGIGAGASVARSGGFFKNVMRGGGKLLGVAGAVYGVYDLYTQARDTGSVSYLDSALTGGAIGATIGSFVPVVGTAIGGAVGAAVGALGAAAYNNSDLIVKKWREASTWIGSKTDQVQAGAKAAWDGTTNAYHRMTSIVGDTLTHAWEGVKSSFETYSGRVDDWIRTQAKNVGTWLDDMVYKIESTVSSFNLRQVALQFMDRLRQWLKDRLGLGGGSSGGGAPETPSAPPTSTGQVPNSVVPSGRGRGPTYVGADGKVSTAPRHDPAMYAPGTVASDPNASAGMSSAKPVSPGPGRTDAKTGITGFGSGDSSVGFGPGGVTATPKAGSGAGLKPVGDGTVPSIYQQGGVSTGTESLGKPGEPVAHSGVKGEERFSVVGNAAAAGIKNVDPALVEANREASKYLPKGYRVEMFSGYRAGDPRFHGQGKAGDFAIYDDKGHRLENYQHPENFATYEHFAQEAHRYLMEKYPEKAAAHRFGGYFGGRMGAGGTYGANDIMHQDMGGDRVGMAAGSWAKGLNSQYRGVFDTPGAPSVGMNQMKDDPTTTEAKRVEPPPLAQRGFLGGFHTEGDDQGPPSAVGTMDPLPDPNRPERTGAGGIVGMRKAMGYSGPSDTTAAKTEPGGDASSSPPRDTTAYRHEGVSTNGMHNMPDAYYGSREQTDLATNMRKVSDAGRGTSMTDFRLPDTKNGLAGGISGDVNDRGSGGLRVAPKDDAPKPTTTDEVEGKYDTGPEKSTPPPDPPKDTPAQPGTKHGKMSMDDIPTVHPNVHLAVSGHTDNYA